MTTITQIRARLQELFTTQANDIARETGFIRRQRKLSGAQFLQATVWGWLQHPNATRHQLHQSLLLTGVKMSAQGFDQRFSPQAVVFLRRMVEETLSQVFEARVLCPLLERFQGIYLTDSTRLESAGGPLKVAARLELQRGSLRLSLEEGQTHDNRTAVSEHPLPAGALHVGDLGFFDLKRFARWTEARVNWISRYKVGTTLYSSAGQAVALGELLPEGVTQVRCRVMVGSTRLAAVLHAQRVRPPVSRQRLERLSRHASRKQYALSARQISLADWTIYLTSVDDLTFEQVHTLYRARWQIECLFKRWKSLGRLDTSSTTDPHRRACELFAKLLAVLLIHWLSQAYTWHEPHLSHALVFCSLQSCASLLRLALFQLPSLAFFFDTLVLHLVSVSRLSSRKTHPNAVQLWEQFNLLA